MNKIFSISDTWFNRPIGEKSDMSVSDYNNELIENWNKIVGKTDDVYVLGGFGISELYNIVTKLKGNIYFLNNFYTNDEKLFRDNLKLAIDNSMDKKLANRIKFLDCQIMPLVDDDIILSYFPLSEWYGKNSGTFCFHGLNTETNFDECNISCCSLKNNFRPVNMRDYKDKINAFSDIMM